MTTARLFVGTSGWSYSDWVGPLYPAGTAPGAYLAHYCREFGAVEIDSTFYRIPTTRMVDGWRAASPDGFRFDAAFRVDALPVLAAFLAELPPDLRYAVEIRHRGWLTEEFTRLLEVRRVALVLPDLYYMPRLDRVTTDFAYIRLLGKRSAVPDDFSHVRIERDRELALWAERIRGYLAGGVTVFAFANNHYQGHGPATARALLSRVAAPASSS